MKSYVKWLAAAVGLICIVVVFQNCSKKDTKASGGKGSLSGPDAQELISVMESAGIQDPVAVNSLALPERISLVAENMNCSRMTTTNARQCVFKVKKDDGTFKTVKTTAEAAMSVIDLLYASGAKLTCTSDCNGVESYLVTSVACTKNTNFPDQSTCSFVK